MIHLILNSDGTNTIKDLSPEEAEAWLIQQARRQCPAIGYKNVRWSEGDTSLWISCASNVRREAPVTKEFRSRDGKAFRFRGPVTISGRDGQGAKVSLPQGYVAQQLANGAHIEFGFQGDPIFIPSFEEWLLIPEKKREDIACGLWCWSRTYAEEGKVIQLWDDSNSIERPTVSLTMADGRPRSNGAVAAIINIDLLPEDVGAKLCKPAVGEFRTPSGEYFHSVKLSEHFCALRGHDIEYIMGGNLHPLHADISTIKYGYEESSLRKALLGSLDKLCDIIRNDTF